MSRAVFFVCILFIFFVLFSHFSLTYCCYGAIFYPTFICNIFVTFYHFLCCGQAYLLRLMAKSLLTREFYDPDFKSHGRHFPRFPLCPSRSGNTRQFISGCSEQMEPVKSTLLPHSCRNLKAGSRRDFIDNEKLSDTSKARQTIFICP